MRYMLPLCLFAATLATPALAQPQAADHAAHHPASAASASADMTVGEVRKVDKDTKKITISMARSRTSACPP